MGRGIDRPRRTAEPRASPRVAPQALPGPPLRPPAPPSPSRLRRPRRLGRPFRRPQGSQGARWGSGSLDQLIVVVEK